MTASTPSKRPLPLMMTGMPPPPAAMTMRPASTSSRMMPLGTTSMGLGEGDDLAVAPAGVLDHRPLLLAGQLLAPELRVERADRLGRLGEGRVVLVDDDLGDERGDLLVDGAPPQLVDERPLQHEAHAALGHGVADVERIGRDLVGRLLHLDEEVPDLGPVAVDDDELVALADDVDHELGRPLGVPHLLRLQTFLVFGQHGVAAEGDEGDLRSHRASQNFFRTSLSVGVPISSSS